MPSVGGQFCADSHSDQNLEGNNTLQLLSWNIFILRIFSSSRLCNNLIFVGPSYLLAISIYVSGNTLLTYFTVLILLNFSPSLHLRLHLEDPLSHHNPHSSEI